MRVFVVIGFLAALVTPGYAATCDGMRGQIEQLMSELNNTSLGMCQMARKSVQLYRVAADYSNQCEGNAAQTEEYLRAADQAQLTANASCSM